MLYLINYYAAKRDMYMSSDKENRILELLKNNNLNYKDLIMYLIEETNGEESDYNNIKTNFSKMISGERKFKYEYIPPNR